MDVCDVVVVYIKVMMLDDVVGEYLIYDVIRLYFLIMYYKILVL